ncbi:deaminase domain-containing protein [Luteibacter sp.]|uniref:deaminase domain-containing protein n=1 Tax=Luteibacter sp. TaxID=1886636 RepID=UPI0025C1F6B9|nr:deaminase domain-containing protein [Luteibacter sp.]
MSVIKSTKVVFCGLCLLASLVAGAHPVLKRKIHDDPRGTVTARVLAAFTPHARAAGLWYLAALEGRRVDTQEFTAFSQQFESATFVSATYQYEIDGTSYRRVYHARSGWNEPRLGIPGLRAVRDYSAYFEASTDVIAWDRTPPRHSTVTARPLDDGRAANARDRDAELKIARQIERDIRNGRVRAGGYLAVYSSQEPCASCEPALQALSDARGIRVHVAFLGRQSPAYRTFDRLRHQHMTTIEVSVNGGQIHVLNHNAAVMDQVPAPVDCMEPENHEDLNEV